MKNIVYLMALLVFPVFAEPGGRGAGNGKDGKMSMFFQYYADQMATTGVSNPPLKQKNEDSKVREFNTEFVDLIAIQEFVDDGNVVSDETSSLFLDRDTDTRYLNGKVYINTDQWNRILASPDHDKKIIYVLLCAKGHGSVARELAEFYSQLIRSRNSEVTSLNPSNAGVRPSKGIATDLSDLPILKRSPVEQRDSSN